jgi:hypothetical protein
MAPPAASSILTETMLQRFRDRAPGYDRENRFFQEDFGKLALGLNPDNPPRWG